MALTVSLESPSIPFKLSSLFCTTESHFKLVHDFNPFNQTPRINKRLMIHSHMSYETNKKSTHTSSDVRLLNVKSSFSKFLKTDKPFTCEKKTNTIELNEMEKQRKNRDQREGGSYIRKSLVIELESGDGKRVLGLVIVEELLCIQASHSRENPSCSARNRHCLPKTPSNFVVCAGLLD